MKTPHYRTEQALLEAGVANRPQCSVGSLGRFPGIYTAVCFNNFFSKIRKLTKLRKKNYQLLLADKEKIFCQAQKKRFGHFLKDFHLPCVPT